MVYKFCKKILVNFYLQFYLQLEIVQPKLLKKTICLIENNLLNLDLEFYPYLTFLPKSFSIPGMRTFCILLLLYKSQNTRFVN